MLLVTTDLHLKDTELDEYRWGIFAWLRTQAQKHNVEEVLLLGDVTDRKEGHSARLVNRLYSEVQSLAEVAGVVWLMGNHDFFVDQQVPFFEFVNDETRIQYIKQPTVVELSIGKATFVPAGAQWHFNLHNFPYVFTHATFTGAIAENGTTLTGVDPAVLDGYEGIVYSGDIHRPQDLRDNICYVGAPYHVRFGDSYKPRVLLLTDKGEETDLYFPAPRKLVLNITKPADLLKERVSAADHVKIRCHMTRADYVQWKQYRQDIREIAADKKWVVFGVEQVPLELSGARRITEMAGYSPPERLVEMYAAKQKASDEHIRIARELLRSES